ncbi:MAG: MarR family transcriptional regulator [Thermoanaerobaculia bacterium]
MPTPRANPRGSQPRELFGFTLGQLARMWRVEIDRRLSPYGLTEARWMTLLHLSRIEGPVTQRALAEVVSVQGPTLVRTLDWLEGRGFIERQRLAGDRRAKSLHLTERAAPTLERIHSVVEGLRAEILSGVDDTELESCLRTFRKIAAHLGGDPWT